LEPVENSFNCDLKAAGVTFSEH